MKKKTKRGEEIYGLSANHMQSFSKVKNIQTQMHSRPPKLGNPKSSVASKALNSPWRKKRKWDTHTVLNILKKMGPFYGES